MSNHEAKVVRIEEIVKHPNADALGLVYVGGFQVVVRLDQFKVGDLAVYVQPDSLVPVTEPFRFIWGEKQEPDGTVKEKYRRITVRRFRKEWSEGLLLPVSDFPELVKYARGTEAEGVFPQPGDDVADILGIEHWNPPDPEEERGPSNRQSRTKPKSLKGWLYYLRYLFLRVVTFGIYNPYGNTGGSNEKAPSNTPPIYDVENFKHYQDVFVPGETVVVSEKIHGSNARYVFQTSLLNPSGKMYAGSRQFWKRFGSNNIWRKLLEKHSDLQAFLLKYPGHTIYGEVTPTQGGGFNYKSTKDQPEFWAFDILRPDGTWVPYTEAREMTAGLNISWAPLLYHGPYDADHIAKLVDGPTRTGDTHIREGVVISCEPDRHVRGLGRLKLKIVSNQYLLKSDG